MFVLRFELDIGKICDNIDNLRKDLQPNIVLNEMIKCSVCTLLTMIYCTVSDVNN